MKLHVFDLLTNTRKPYIDKYLKQTGIELTTLIPNYQVSIENPKDYKRIVHLLLVAYLHLWTLKTPIFKSVKSTVVLDHRRGLNNDRLPFSRVRYNR
jgi:hypothetical protein